VILAAVASSVLLAAPAFAQQKTAKECTAEWRANKADNQARGITEKAFVAQCRAGGSAAAPAAPAAAPAQAATKPAAGTQQKTAKECTAEWRANKADNQARGITEKAFVAQCRAGGTAAVQPTAAPAATQPAQPPTAAAPAPRTRSRTGGTTALAPPGSAEEAQVRARCPSDTVVWVNEESKIYHFSGHKAYGTTKQGKYMCERDAVAAGNRAAKNEKR
jgi:sulfur transfer complex TusBCD TusB component (DsrH family)